MSIVVIIIIIIKFFSNITCTVLYDLFRLEKTLTIIQLSCIFVNKNLICYR